MAAVIVPLFAYDTILQCLRLSLRLDDLVARSSLQWLSGIVLSVWWLAGDVAFALFACALLLIRNQGGRLWFASAITIQALAFLVGLVNTAAYVYFMQTLDALDFPLFSHMVRAPRDLALVMSGEVSAGQALLVVLVFALEIVAPWVARLYARRLPETPYAGPERRSLRVAQVAFCSALPVFLCGALPPPIAYKDLALVRAPLLEVALTAHEPLDRVDPSIDRAVTDAHFFEPGAVNIEPDGQPRRRRNLVFVLLESTRASATTPYNPALKTTPFLARLAARSLVVDKAYAIVPSTQKALTAVFCSLFPSPTLEPRALTTGLLGRCLPRLLAEQGYQTMYMQSANARFENRIRAVANMGFDTFVRPEDMPSDGFQQANFLGFEDDVMLEPNEAWLRQHGDRPFFAAYLTVDPHHDYAPLSRRGIFHFEHGDDETLGHYLNNVRYEDAFLEQLFAQYQRLGLLEKTLFVIVGDHGEGFGEHGRRAHNTVPYEEALRVPLLIHDGGGTLFKPMHLSGPISQLDIVPTVLPMLGFRLSRGRLHGISMFESPRERVLMMACVGGCAARVTDTEAVVHHFGRRPDELYDLRTDPEERLDIADQYPQVVARRIGELNGFLRRVASFYFLQRLRRD